GGKVVVDSGAEDHAEAVAAAIDELPGDSVTALFNTHWHLDQIGGNATLAAAGATIFAHEKTRIRLTTGYYLPDEERYRTPVPVAARSTGLYYADGAPRLGERQGEFGYRIEACSDGDIYVAVPDLNVIAVVDVVSPQIDPVFDW